MIIQSREDRRQLGHIVEHLLTLDVDTDERLSVRFLDYNPRTAGVVYAPLEDLAAAATGAPLRANELQLHAAWHDSPTWAGYISRWPIGGPIQLHYALAHLHDMLHLAAELKGAR